MGEPVTHATATIANGASQSGVIDLRNHYIAAILMPAAWTSADVTFAASDTADGTFGQVCDAAGSVVTLVNGANTGRRYILDTDLTRGLAFVKVVSGTVAAGTNQGAARDVKVALVAVGS